jgi:hypothetical protein
VQPPRHGYLFVLRAATGQAKPAGNRTVVTSIATRDAKHLLAQRKNVRSATYSPAIIRSDLAAPSALFSPELFASAAPCYGL